MPQLDAGPVRIDVTGLTIGDSLEMQFVFDFDISGFTEWVAKVRKGELLLPFDIDETQVGDDTIIGRLSSEQTGQLSTGALYDLRAKTPAGGVETMAHGRFDDMRQPVSEAPA